MKTINNFTRFFSKIKENNRNSKINSKFLVCYDTTILQLPFSAFNILFELDNEDIKYLENKYKYKLEEEKIKLYEEIEDTYSKLNSTS